MNKFSICILLSIVSISSIYSQDKFVKIYGSNYREWAWDLIQAEDDGFAIIGQSSKSNDDIILIKTNQEGDTVFTSYLGGDGWDYAYSLKQTSDGGYVIAGSTTSYGAGNYDMYLAKTDNNGSVIWTRSFGGSKSDGGGHVEETEDGGYIILGYTHSYGLDNGSAFLVKTDQMGQTEWEKFPDCGSTGCFATNILVTSDNNYVICGTTIDNHVFLIKTNSEGEKIWSQIYDYYSESFGESILETQDGGFIIVGTAYKYNSIGAYSSDVLIIGTDATGDTTWTKTIGDRMYDYGTSIDYTSDGGYIVTGSTDNMKFFDKDIYLIKINHSGDTVWTRPYHLEEHEYAYSVKETADKGFSITGKTEFGSGKQNIFLLKTDSLGQSNLPFNREYNPGDTITIGDTITNMPNFETSKTDFLVIYPNPASDKLHIKQQKRQKTLVEIIDIRGNVVYKNRHSGENISIEINHLPRGLYLLKVKSNKDTHLSKIMINHGH